MHIGAAAKLLGVTAHHLRTLEWEGRIPPARRDLNGRIDSTLDLAMLRSMGIGSCPRRLKSAEEILRGTE
jgi:DNA-binding transcriptional MerR regulator